MALVESDDVIQQVSPAASDPPLGHPVLPGTLEGWPDANHIHGSRGKGDLQPILCISIKDEVFRRGLIRKGFAQLLDDPCAGRMLRDVEMEDLATIMAEDEEAVEHAESHGRDGKEVHRRDGFAMIPEAHP